MKLIATQTHRNYEGAANLLCTTDANYVATYRIEREIAGETLTVIEGSEAQVLPVWRRMAELAAAA
jgi:hypothetical protein